MKAVGRGKPIPIYIINLFFPTSWVLTVNANVALFLFSLGNIHLRQTTVVSPNSFFGPKLSKGPEGVTGESRNDDEQQPEIDEQPIGYPNAEEQEGEEESRVKSDSCEQIDGLTSPVSRDDEVSEYSAGEDEENSEGEGDEDDEEGDDVDVFEDGDEGEEEGEEEEEEEGEEENHDEE